jgi:divalent metal cation (Fe/Co/Zn/Cd) transporter
MGIGVGILLLVVGLVLILGVFPDIPQVDDITLGWILLIVGALGIVLVLIMNAQRRRTVVERRDYDDRIR